MSNWRDFLHALRLCLSIWLIAASIFVVQGIILRWLPSDGYHVPSRPYVSVMGEHSSQTDGSIPRILQRILLYCEMGP
ncbi:hypothetical protein [Alicyclobacillus shizuokensis]|uniref:hypothetical protein n=1 Tax=Alicyclobacillus shizuokensis TaxID=392014 RepID=UPI00082984C7|nr:hypothetical protein [Alicyclobacillus shizuokensis]MCL6625527.1 hypothetical protein [Alicyclobacillus shizuokensis]